MRRRGFCALLVAAGAAAQTSWEALRDHLAARNTRALVVVQDGRTVYEWYAPGNGPDRPHFTASLAKSLVGGMSLLLALGDGKLGLDDPAARYIPAWRQDPRKSRITIRHLATHSSGIEDAEQDHLPHEKLPGWKGAFWRRQPDPFSIAIHQAPALFPPAERYHYSNPGMAALAWAVTAGLGVDLRSLLRERLLRPLGVPDTEWSIGYGETHDLDGLNLVANWGGGSFTPRAAARVGQLMLQRGRLDGRQLVDAAWAERMTSYAETALPERPGGAPNPASGLCWWTNFDGIWGGVPRDAFAGAGAQHQLLLVVPSRRLVAVRNGGALGEPFWAAAFEHFFRPLMQAAGPATQAPYPASSVIRGVVFAPEPGIVRKAVDSDNWPLTWADDGDLYTSYGDGWGFDPRVDRKLSQGFVRISGPPEAFEGINIRSPSGERLGDGAKGPKASGILMVNGVLYLWVRNTSNSQLAWSSDWGRNWQWGFRFDTGFGSPAFLNFGQNYQGDRDGYVYVYSQDGPSAYASDDGLALARAPKDRLRERGAWEFFVRLEPPGRPIWTRDISRRGAVFRFPGRCQRVDAVHNPGLRRYLLALGYDHQGGWGLFDAPEPWGPWTTVYHTDNWGLGGTHGYRLPSKWISAGGTTMHLVFSGVKPNDAFCVRRLTLVPFVGRP